MDGNEWHIWCNSVTDKLTNLEKTLTSYKQVSKRMLWFNTLLLLGIIGLNGILLFYK